MITSRAGARDQNGAWRGWFEGEVAGARAPDRSTVPFWRAEEDLGSVPDFTPWTRPAAEPSGRSGRSRREGMAIWGPGRNIKAASWSINPLLYFLLHASPSHA
jgi:hypothetical protein